MTTRRASILTLCGAGALFLTLSGCYTQIESTREEQVEGAGNEYRAYQPSYYNDTIPANDSGYATEYDNPAVYNNDYGYGWHPWCGVGFNYYYPSYYWPSYAFNAAYYDPWYYDSYWAYDPWWCGTPYVGYRMYGHYPPFYFYGSYYGSYYGPYRRGYTYAAGPVNRLPRDFGSTRGVSARGQEVGSRYAPPVAGSGGGPLPTGARIDGRSNTRASASTNARRAYVPRGRSGYVNAPGGRSVAPRGGAVRQPAPSGRGGPAPRSSSPGPRYSPAPRGSSGPPSGGGARGGGGGGGRSGGGGHGGGRR